MRKLDKLEAAAQKIVLLVMGMRGDIPQWRVDTNVTSSTYKAFYNSGLPVIRAEGSDSVFLVYVRTDEEAAKVFRLVGVWPRTFWFKNKILKYLSKTPRELPAPV